MFKLSFILMLAATQLLGSSRAVYLCINVDGEMCCLDAGPKACVCCHHDDHPPSPHIDCGHGPERCDSHSCEHQGDDREGDDRDSRTPQADETPAIAYISSECSHQLVATGQTASVGRSTVNHDLLDALQFWGCVPPLLAKDDSLWRVAESEWPRPPLKRSAALMVLSTVNIRC